MMEIKPVELLGKRVKILPMEVYQVQDLFDAGNNPNIWTYLPIKVQTIKDMEDLVKKALQERERKRTSFCYF